MRSEQEMMNLILDVAKKEERVRAVYMNGSRTNTKVCKDQYQDFDIVFVVTETMSFLMNKDWISVFGELAIMQQPDSDEFGWGQDHNCSRSYTWLMLFKDNNRIDLKIKTLECALEDYKEDTLCVKLLDKDEVLPQIPEAKDNLYWIKAPTRQEYNGCCNEFWWCLNNVAKGLARDQMPYALRMYNQTVHIELERMVEWYIGISHSFSVSTGMWGKYFKRYMSTAMYEQYISTYSTGIAKNLWEAIFNAYSLFEKIAMELADYFDYIYPTQDAQNMMAYLEYVKNG